MADKHVITELPLVPFAIINLTSSTAGVCMKVRFKVKVTTARLAFAGNPTETLATQANHAVARKILFKL